MSKFWLPQIRETQKEPQYHPREEEGGNQCDIERGRGHRGSGGAWSSLQQHPGQQRALQAPPCPQAPEIRNLPRSS